MALFDKILIVNNLERHNFTLLTLYLTIFIEYPRMDFPYLGFTIK